MAAAVSHPMPIIERLSEYKWLPLVPMFFVLSGVYVGVYACLYPYGVLGMFGLSVDVPWSSNELKITEFLITLWGIREIFMGFALLCLAISATRPRRKRVLGMIMIAVGIVKFGDLLACIWILEDYTYTYPLSVPSSMSLLIVFGAQLMGTFDR